MNGNLPISFTDQILTKVSVLLAINQFKQEDLIIILVPINKKIKKNKSFQSKCFRTDALLSAGIRKNC